MRAQMQKMMGAMQGQDTPDMEGLMDSIKAEEQVKAPPLSQIPTSSAAFFFSEQLLGPWGMFICSSVDEICVCDTVFYSGCRWYWKAKEKVWQSEAARPGCNARFPSTMNVHWLFLNQSVLMPVTCMLV